jgi:selenocysteine-specific elongation factor
MGTAGHVDHGKTSLIRALTGIDCDTHKEEKARGITINLGFAHLELSNDISVGIVDVPGHKDFIKTMVAGVYGIDFVLLVVAADSGIMPQTREHFKIMQVLGIQHGIVALTKSDLADEEMRELAKLEIMEFLENTPLADAPIVEVSAITMHGINELKKAMLAMAQKVNEKPVATIFRMYIDRIFNVKGHGIVVTGSALGGKVAIGQELYLLPGNRDKLRIKSIQRHGQAVKETSAGDRAAINVSGLKYDDFERGQLLADRRLDETTMADALVEYFEPQPQSKIWSHVIFHTGTFTTYARMHLLVTEENDALPQMVVQLHFEKPAILINKDKFIIRNSSNDLTLGGGTILDVKPLHHRRRTEALKQRMTELARVAANEQNKLQHIFIESEKEGKPLLLQEAAHRTGVSVNEIRQLVSENSGILILINAGGEDYLVTATYQKQLTGRIIEILKKWHQENTFFEAGLEMTELLGKLGLRSAAEKELLALLLGTMSDAGTLKNVDKTFALKSHRTAMDKKQQEALEWLRDTLKYNKLNRLTLKELEQKAHEGSIKKSTLAQLIQYMQMRHELYTDGEDVLDAASVDASRLLLLHALTQAPRGLNEKEFRELTNAPRKTIQMLIDIFVKEGVITKETFFLHITETGKSLLDGG